MRLPTCNAWSFQGRDRYGIAGVAPTAVGNYGAVVKSKVTNIKRKSCADSEQTCSTSYPLRLPVPTPHTVLTGTFNLSSLFRRTYFFLPGIFTRESFPLATDPPRLQERVIESVDCLDMLIGPLGNVGKRRCVWRTCLIFFSSTPLSTPQA